MQLSKGADTQRDLRNQSFANQSFANLICKNKLPIHTIASSAFYVNSMQIHHAALTFQAQRYMCWFVCALLFMSENPPFHLRNRFDFANQFQKLNRFNLKNQ